MMKSRAFPMLLLCLVCLSGCSTMIPFTLVNDRTGEQGSGVLYDEQAVVHHGQAVVIGLAGEAYHGVWSHIPTPENPDKYFFSGQSAQGHAIRCTATFTNGKAVGECSDNRNATYSIRSPGT